jgi:enterochelin esterase-like enzyme
VQIAKDPAGGTVWAGTIPNRFVPTARRTALVYLPPHASATARYPVVFLLQGLPGSPYSFADGLRLPEVADRLVATHVVPPFVAVMPPAGLTGRFDGEWTGPWERFFVRGVVPWADAHLPIARSPAERSVAGLSAGGYGAVDIGLRRLGMYGTLQAWSGSFTAPHDGSLRGAGAAAPATHDPTLLVEREATLVRRLGIRIFLSCGSTHDRATAAGTRAFARVLTALRLRHRLWLGPGGHDGKFWRSQLVPALEYGLRR